MAKIIITTTEEKKWEAYKVLETLVDFSVVKKDENKFEFRANSNDGIIAIEMKLEEFENLLKEMKSL